MTEVVYEVGDYQVVIGDFRLGEWKGEQGYLILNTRHNVVEGETNVEAAAIRIAKDLDEDLQKTLQGQEEEVIDPDNPEQMFQALENRYEGTD